MAALAVSNRIQHQNILIRREVFSEMEAGKKNKEWFLKEYNSRRVSVPDSSRAVLKMESEYQKSLRKLIPQQWFDRVMKLPDGNRRTATACIVWWDMIGGKIANHPIEKDPFYKWLTTAGGASLVSPAQLARDLKRMGYSEHQIVARMKEDEE